MKLSIEQANAVYKILRETEIRIAEATGRNFELVLREKGSGVSKPEDMLLVIANALGFSVDEYKYVSKRTKFVMQRWIGAYFLRMHYPNLSLKDIGDYFEQDHSTIINAIAGAKDAIATEEIKFMQKFHIAQNAISEWLAQ